MVAQVRAPKGGTRIGGRYYRGGEFISHKYERGGQVVSGSPSTRLVDPAWSNPDLAPNMGRPILPHISTFIGVESSFSKAYRFPDEALKHSVQNAHMMLNDPAVFEPMNSRILLTSQLNWHVTPENEEDPRQKYVAEMLGMLLRKIKHFPKYLETLMWATWYGRYAIQNQFSTMKRDGRNWYYVSHWTPVSGDKLLFRFDDGSGKYDSNQIGLRMSPAITKPDEIAGLHELEATYDGLAYFLKDWERRAFVVHSHMRMDGEYESPRDAGRIHGIGLRNFLYWIWYQKQETLAQLVEIVERTASGFMIYYYPEGNAEAKAEVEKIARTQAHTNVLIMPHSADGQRSYEPQVIPANTSGIDALAELIREHFNHPIKRTILGQILSSEADSTGLGSGVATLQRSTLANIVKYDAANLEETITRELVWVLRDINFPEWRDVDFRFYLDTEEADPSKKLAAIRQAWEMGLSIPSQAAYEALGVRKPKDGEEKLFNPVVLQQIRLAEQQLHESGSQSALGGILGDELQSQTDPGGGGPEGNEEAPAEETGATPIDTHTTRVATNLASKYYGSYWSHMMGGDSDPEQYRRRGEPVRYQGTVDEQGNLHAPEGGVTLAGKFFEGGKFITKGDLANANPQELQMLKMQFAGDPQAAQVIDQAAQGGDGEPDSGQATQEQEELASEWGKPIQVNAGNFLIRQIQALKNAGFNVDVSGDRDEQIRQAIRQLREMEPMMQGFVDAASAMGFRPSKAQGLVARVNNATHNIFLKAESLGWKGQGTFKERFMSASQFLIDRGEAEQQQGQLKSEVAEAALRLASRVLKVPLAKAFGGRFSGNPKSELAEASAYLKALQEGITADSQLVPAEAVEPEEGRGESAVDPAEAESTEGGDPGQPEEKLLPTSWDDIPNYDADLRRIMADALGVKDVSPLAYQENVKLLEEAHAKATANFQQTHGAISDAIGAKNLKGMVKEAKNALKGGHFRGLSALVNHIEGVAPEAVKAITGTEGKEKAVLNWLANANTLKPPAMNSPDTVEEYRNHPAVAGMRDLNTAEQQGVAETDEVAEKASEAEQAPQSFADIQDYSYEDHATLRDATGMDLSPSDYQALAPYLNEAHQMALQEYQDTHGALHNAIGSKQMGALRRKARSIVNPKGKNSKPGDAADLKGFDLILDRVKQNAAGALDLIRGEEDESTALLNWLAEGSAIKAPGRDHERVAELLSANPDVQQYLEQAGSDSPEPEAKEQGSPELPPDEFDTWDGGDSGETGEHEEVADKSAAGGYGPSKSQSVAPSGPSGDRATVKFPDEFHHDLFNFTGLMKGTGGKNPKAGSGERQKARLERLMEHTGKSHAEVREMAKRYQDAVKKAAKESLIPGETAEIAAMRFDELDELESIPFNRPDQSVKYTRSDFGYVSQSGNSLNCGNCRYLACGQCLLFDRRNQLNPQRYQLDPAVSESGICDWYETQGNKE